jgi:hypothetical protein
MNSDQGFQQPAGCCWFLPDPMFPLKAITYLSFKPLYHKSQETKLQNLKSMTANDLNTCPPLWPLAA